MELLIDITIVAVWLGLTVGSLWGSIFFTRGEKLFYSVIFYLLSFALSVISLVLIKLSDAIH
jgi:hypothetical protein